jgi:hypothetical protein
MNQSMTRRRFVAVAGAAGLAFASFALAGCGDDSSTDAASTTSADDSAKDASSSTSSKALRFVTGGESGTYYAFGSVIAQHATNNTDTAVTGVVGNGSQANVISLEDGEAELAFCQSDVMAYAYNGTNLFEETGAVTCFSTVGLLYNEQIQIVTCDENIKTVADLKGKTVSIGAAGSGVYFNAIDILGAYDIAESDISPTYQSFGDSADALKDGKIDAAFIVAGAPTTAITDLSTSKTAYLVGLDQEHIDALIASSDYYIQDTIAAGTYSGQDEDVLTVAVGAVILAADTVSEDDVYNITADIFDNAADLVESHAKYAEVSIENGASITSVPYHPGAAKYFAEQGIDVPTK